MEFQSSPSPYILSPRGEGRGEGANLVFIRVYSWINSCIFVEICVHSC